MDRHVSANPGGSDALSGAVEEGPHLPTGAWVRVGIQRIEDLREVVYGGGLEPAQRSGMPVTGSLAFAETGGVLYSSGELNGHVSIRGPLSPDRVTVGMALTMPPGCRQWLQEIRTGQVGVFLPGDEHDALYNPGASYAVATLLMDDLEERAARAGLVLDRRTLGGTGMRRDALPPAAVAELRQRFLSVHRPADEPVGLAGDPQLGEDMLDLIIAHLARHPEPFGAVSPQSRARIVAAARAYIHEHLREPIKVDDVARAAHTSIRSLHRAFKSVLDETPASYIRSVRLHRIRTDLLQERPMVANVSRAASRWGVQHGGRLARVYRERFGEYPSETVAQRDKPSVQGRVASVLPDSAVEV